MAASINTSTGLTDVIGLALEPGLPFGSNSIEPSSALPSDGPLRLLGQLEQAAARNSVGVAAGISPVRSLFETAGKVQHWVQTQSTEGARQEKKAQIAAARRALELLVQQGKNSAEGASAVAALDRQAEALRAQLEALKS